MSKILIRLNNIGEIHPSLPSRQAGVIQTNYDIVKTHGGELKVETKEREESEFVIQLLVV